MKLCYDSTSRKFVLVRIVRFYQYYDYTYDLNRSLFFGSSNRRMVDQNRYFNNYSEESNKRMRKSHYNSPFITTKIIKWKIWEQSIGSSLKCV